MGNIIKLFRLDKIKGNWNYWGKSFICLFLLCLLSSIFSRILKIEKYAINSKEYIIQPIPSTLKHSNVFFPDSEKLTFEGKINGKNKYFLIQRYPLSRFGGRVPKELSEQIYAIINKNDLEYLGNTKYNPIYIILQTSIKNRHLKTIKNPNKTVIFNINSHLIYHTKFLGISLMNLIYYGFWLWVIWGVCYLIYVYLLKDNLDEG